MVWFLGLKKNPQGVGKTKYKPHWSDIFDIQHVKLYGQSYKYKVNGKFYFEHSLQKVPNKNPMVFKREKKAVKQPRKKKGKAPAPPPESSLYTNS